METSLKKNKLGWFQLFIFFGIILIMYFLISFVLLPNLSVLEATFIKDGKFTLSAFEKIVKSKRVMESLQNSFLLALTLPLLTSLIGIFQVLFIDYFDIKGRKLLMLCYLVPLVFGGLLINNGYIFAYGPNGIFTNLASNFFSEINTYWFQGYYAVLIAMSFGCTTNYMMFFRNVLNTIDFHTVEAGKNLGASQWSILKKIVLPQVRPMIVTCIVLLFQQGLGAMAAPLILGGKDFQTITPLILTLAGRPSSRDIAAILAIIQGVFSIGVLLIIQKMEKGKNFMSISKTKARLERQRIANKGLNLLAHSIAYLLALLNAIPFVSVILFSFTDYQTIGNGRIGFDSFTLDNYKSILMDPSAYSPFITSVFYAFIAAFAVALIAMFIGRVSHKHRNKIVEGVELLIYLPWILPGILFALGLILLYSVPQFWINYQVLTGGYLILLIAYIVVMLPNTYRFTRTAYFGVNQDLEDAAQNLGANNFYTFSRIVLPVIIPTVLALFALNFNGKLGEYELAAFLFHPLKPTLGIVIRQNADPTARIDAKAINLVYSVLLIVINILVVWFVYYDGIGQMKKWFNKRTLLNGDK